MASSRESEWSRLQNGPGFLGPEVSAVGTLLGVETNTEHVEIAEPICPRRRTAHSYGFVAKGMWYPVSRFKGPLDEALPVLARLSIVAPGNNLVTGLAIRFYPPASSLPEGISLDLITACINPDPHLDFTQPFSNACCLPKPQSWLQAIRQRIADRYLSLSGFNSQYLDIHHLGGPPVVHCTLEPNSEFKTITQVVESRLEARIQVRSSSNLKLGVIQLEAFDPNLGVGHDLVFHHGLSPNSGTRCKLAAGTASIYLWDVITTTLDYYSTELEWLIWILVLFLALVDLL